MLTPTHLIELTDAELEQLREGLKAIGKDGLGSPLGWKLGLLPGLTTEDGNAYTDRGEQAVTRMLVEGSGRLTSANPHGEDLRSALRRDELARAKLEVSVSEGKPGEERSAIVDEYTAAMDALRPLAVAYALAYEERTSR